MTDQSNQPVPSGERADPLADIFSQVGKIGADMAAVQSDLDEATVEGSAGGGLVTATVSGSGDLRSVRISSDAVDADDVEMLEDLVTAAVGEALRKAKTLQEERMGAATGGLDLGSLGDLGGLLG